MSIKSVLMLIGRCWRSWNGFMYDDWYRKAIRERKHTATQNNHTRTEAFRWMAVSDKKKTKASIGTMPKYTRSLVSKKTTANSASVVCVFGPHIRHIWHCRHEWINRDGGNGLIWTISIKIQMLPWSFKKKVSRLQIHSVILRTKAF